MKKVSLFFLFCFALSIVIISCKKDDECVTTGLTYTKDIKPMFATCSAAAVGCHHSGSDFGGLTTYAEVKDFVFSDKLISSLKHEAGSSAMPKGLTKFSDCNISKVEAWIKAGKPQ